MKILEVNIDDLNCGGVYILIKTIIENKPDYLNIDIASIEGFEKKENEKAFTDKGCRIFNVNNCNNKFLKQYMVYKTIRSLIVRESYDCVHVHGDTANKLFVSCYAAKKEKVKLIIAHSHASGVEGNHRFIKKIIHRLCRVFLNRLGIKKVACSNLAAKWMFGSEKDVKIINNGIDTKKFKFNPQIRKFERDKLGLKDELLIGSVGRFCYPKNHLYMLKIAKQLRERNVNYKMIFIGAGELKEYIMLETDKMGLSNNIIFYGVSNRIQDLLQAVDVFIMPSIYEGFPIAGVEAQANGIPTIYSSNLTKEVCITKNSAMLDIDDKSIDCWCDYICKNTTDSREKYADEVRKAGFDIQTTIDQMILLYS